MGSHGTTEAPSGRVPANVALEGGPGAGGAPASSELGCWRAALLLGAIGLGCGASAAQAPPSGDARALGSSSTPRGTPETPRLKKPEWIPPQAREVLTSRMQRHGEEMMLLVIGVVILSFDGAEELARDIAREPRIGRPAPGEEGTISALLPPRFFDLEDELRERADAVADAARDRDAPQLATTYGRLVETCVSCHSVYGTPPVEASAPSQPRARVPR